MAIDNAQLFAETQAALKETEATHRRYLGRAWADFVPTRVISGYTQTGAETMPLGDELLPEVRQAMMEQRQVIWSGDDGKSLVEGATPSALAMPITLRGQQLGVLGFKEEEGRRWSKDDVALAQALAEQFALAADNLRLIDETRRRAAREQLTREITDKMRSTVDMDDLMQTTLRDMGAALGATRAFVQLSAPPELGGDGNKNRIQPPAEQE